MARVAVVAGGPVGRTRSGLGGGRSRCSLLPSRSLRVVQVARAFVSATRERAVTGSGLTRQAGSAVAGRTPSYPSRIRVERAATRGAAGQEARCPAAAGARQGRSARPAGIKIR